MARPSSTEVIWVRNQDGSLTGDGRPECVDHSFRRLPASTLSQLPSRGYRRLHLSDCDYSYSVVTPQSCVAPLRAFIMLEETHGHPFILGVGVEVAGSVKSSVDDVFTEAYRTRSPGQPENSLQSAVAHLSLGCDFFGDPHLLTFSGAPRSSFHGVFPDAVTSSCSAACSAPFGVECLLLLLRSPDSCRVRKVHPCPDWVVERDPTRHVSGSESKPSQSQGRVDAYKSAIRVRDVAFRSLYREISASCSHIRQDSCVCLSDHLEQGDALLYPSPLRERAKLCKVLSRKQTSPRQVAPSLPTILLLFREMEALIGWRTICQGTRFGRGVDSGIQTG